jgi:hypothetical protein
VPDRHPDQNLLRVLDPAAERLLNGICPWRCTTVSTSPRHPGQLARVWCYF